MQEEVQMLRLDQSVCVNFKNGDQSNQVSMSAKMLSRSVGICTCNHFFVAQLDSKLFLTERR